MITICNKFEENMNFVKEIMQLMENRKFSMSDAEVCASLILHCVEKNNKKLSKAKPFVVLED